MNEKFIPMMVLANAAGNTLSFVSHKPLENQKVEMLALFIYCYDKVSIPLDIRINSSDTEMEESFRAAVTARRWELDRIYGQCGVITTV